MRETLPGPGAAPGRGRSGRFFPDRQGAAGPAPDPDRPADEPVSGQLVLSIFYVTGLFLGPVAGALADRLGHRRLLLWGLVIQGGASFIGASARSPAVLLGTRVLERLGFLIIATAAPSLIYKMVRPGQIPLALRIWIAFVPIGMTLVMLVAPLIIGLFGWRRLWQANAVILLAYALILSLRTRACPGPPEDRRPGGGIYWRTWSKRSRLPSRLYRP